MPKEVGRFVTRHFYLSALVVFLSSMRSVVVIAMLALCSTVAAFRNPFLRSPVARAQLTQTFSSVSDNVKSAIKVNSESTQISSMIEQTKWLCLSILIRI